MSHKLTILLGFLIFCFPFFALAQQSSLNILESSLQIPLSQGQTATHTFTVQNTGTTPLSLVFDTSLLDLTDSNGEMITLSFSPSAPQLTPNQSMVITLTLQADAQISFEQFGGRLIVRDNVTASIQDTIQLDIDVEPDVCDFGQAGSDLRIDIQEPETSDEFKPGDVIPIEVEVENKGQNDIRVQVEAFLFNEDQNIADSSSTTQRIDETSDESFTLNLQIPIDTDNLENNDDLTLIVKAFDDEDEQLNCIQAKQNVNIELEDDDIVIDEEESQLFPPLAACGDTITATVKVINIGSDDNDHVTLSVENRELGIREISETFTLESFDSEEEHTALRHFQIAIPGTARLKSYPIQMGVTFDGGSDSFTLPLDVASCDALPLSGGENDAMLRPLEKNFFGQRGNVLSIPVEITNNQPKKVSLLLTAANIEDFAASTTKTITLNPGAKTTAFYDLALYEDVSPGLYGATFLVKEGARVLASTDVQVTIDGIVPPASKPRDQKMTTLPFLGEVATSVLIIANIILFLFVVLAVRLVILSWKKGS